MATRKQFATSVFRLLFCLSFVAAACYAQNQVLGEISFHGATNVERTSGVWVDGQYVGYLNELKDDKKVLLLPGEHEIAVRQAGYQDFMQRVVIEPGSKSVLQVKMNKDPGLQFPDVFAEVRLSVAPSRAAVFLDGVFVGHVQEFSGHWRGMLVSPGKHEIKIDLPGYQAFETEFNLLPHQKMTIKTDLEKGSITQADNLIKQP
jgi:hypothetical protein